MLDAAGELAVIFNGEVYNFEILRQELEASGHSFHTRSDTEVILVAYRAWGVDAVKRLNGMFSIVLYDAPRDRLVLMRDRLGKKPLFYAYSGSTFAFGSEAKAVLAFPGIERRANLEAIDAYLTFQYVPHYLCAFEGLHKLPPAHVGVIERGGPLKTERYWSLPHPSGITAKPRPETEVREELVGRLEAATRARLVSDVPLGAFLSGGVDSASVVAMMARAGSHPVRTFTIGFDDASYDERRFARMVAERYGTRHQEMEVRPDAAVIVDDLAFHFDEPFADASAVPTYAVSKLARQHVTVALTGDGGDESFLGYERYLALMRLGRAKGIPNWTAGAISGAARFMPDSADRIRLLRRLRRVAKVLGAPRHQRYGALVAYFDDDAKRAIYGEALVPFLNRSALEGLAPLLDASSSLAVAAAWTDMHTYLPDDLLVKVDIASMANALECRSPFLDHELMTWAAGLPQEQRLANGGLKGLLKSAMEPHLPKELLYRPKMGFAAPIDGWIDGALRHRIEDALLTSRVVERGLFSDAAVRKMMHRHQSGERQGYRLWALMMLELWFRQWIDPADPFDEDAAKRIMQRHNDLMTTAAA